MYLIVENETKVIMAMRALIPFKDVILVLIIVKKKKCNPPVRH